MYSRALRCTFFGEWKNSCSSKFLQLELLGKIIKKSCSLKFSLHKFVHLKIFWTLFKNVHCQGPCSLRSCISRTYCSTKHLGTPKLTKLNFYSIDDLPKSLLWPWEAIRAITTIKIIAIITAITAAIICTNFDTIVRLTKIEFTFCYTRQITTLIFLPYNVHYSRVRNKHTPTLINFLTY